MKQKHKWVCHCGQEGHAHVPVTPTPTRYTNGVTVYGCRECSQSHNHHTKICKNGRIVCVKLCNINDVDDIPKHSRVKAIFRAEVKSAK